MKISVELPQFHRRCGTCSLCCTVMGVKELGKEKDVKCELLTPMGKCSIYGEHPASCKEFQCLWLQGLLPSYMQPNRVQAVATSTDEGTNLVFHVPRSERGNWKRGKFREYLTFLASKGIVSIIICGDERLVFGSPEGVDAFFDEVSVDQMTVTRLRLEPITKDGK